MSGYGCLRIERQAFSPPLVYVAARSAMRAEAHACAQLLRNAGALVVSTWHDDNPEKPWIEQQDIDATRGAEEADRDLRQINACDTFVRLSDGGAGTGGNLYENGYALAKGCWLILVGPPVCVFDFLPRVVRALAGADLVAKVMEDRA